MSYKTLELASGTSVQFDHLHKYLLSAVIDNILLCSGNTEVKKIRMPSGAHLLLGKDKIHGCTNNLLELSQPYLPNRILKANT